MMYWVFLLDVDQEGIIVAWRPVLFLNTTHTFLYYLACIGLRWDFSSGVGAFSQLQGV